MLMTYLNHTCTAQDTQRTVLKLGHAHGVCNSVAPVLHRAEITDIVYAIYMLGERSFVYKSFDLHTVIIKLILFF